MARGVSNPGKTARHYRKNAASRRKHVRDNSPGGKYVKSKAYKREHQAARRKLKIRGDQDAVRRNGKLVAGNRKANRARGGAQRA
tara:strand:- start:75 stop:329 length:255 start_codon:yes stop_codon:yes gene_type:complete